MIYTKLILTWMAALLYAYAQTRIPEEKEISMFKFTNWLQEEVCWRDYFVTADFSELFDLLEDDLNFLCKQVERKYRSWTNCVSSEEDTIAA